MTQPDEQQAQHRHRSNRNSRRLVRNQGTGTTSMRTDLIDRRDLFMLHMHVRLIHTSHACSTYTCFTCMLDIYMLHTHGRHIHAPHACSAYMLHTHGRHIHVRHACSTHTCFTLQTGWSTAGTRTMSTMSFRCEHTCHAIEVSMYISNMRVKHVYVEHACKACICRTFM